MDGQMVLQHLMEKQGETNIADTKFRRLLYLCQGRIF